MSNPSTPPTDLDACIEHLRALIRIPSVNPPDGGAEVAAGRDSSGGETAAARYCAEVLTAAGIAAEVLESSGARFVLRAAAATVPTTEPPLVLLSHLDVVPVDAEAWTPRSVRRRADRRRSSGAAARST